MWVQLLASSIHFSLLLLDLWGKGKYKMFPLLPQSEPASTLWTGAQPSPALCQSPVSWTHISVVSACPVGSTAGGMLDSAAHVPWRLGACPLLVPSCWHALCGSAASRPLSQEQGL